MRFYTQKSFDQIPHLQRLPAPLLTRMRAVAAVFPFRVNEYVLDELIDWDRVPDDPIYQLTFPQPGMLQPDHLAHMTRLVRAGASKAHLKGAARTIQRALNPHPAGQLELNRPELDGRPLHGVQHKYRETVLFFPAAGQTCHAYCTYCFRWAQFVGIDELRMASRDVGELVRYLELHPEVTSVLVTGGDPMVMRAQVLRRVIEPLLRVPQLQSIRLGTKSVAYWPHRFVDDPDSDDLLRLFEEVGAAGKTLAIMGHYSHPRELGTPVSEAAVRRIRSTGALIRGQAPLVHHVNDDADVWADLWNLEVRLGVVPYYMFVERDTGAQHHFEVPLARALSIFRQAYRRVSGLGRTVRGPSMSTTHGKVLVSDVTAVGDEKVFALRFIQARNPEHVGKLFFARFDPAATWLDQLVPAGGERRFFFERTGPEEVRMPRVALPVLGGDALGVPAVE